MNDENLNSNESNNKVEIVDVNLLNPFQSNTQNIVENTNIVKNETVINNSDGQNDNIVSDNNTVITNNVEESPQNEKVPVTNGVINNNNNNNIVNEGQSSINNVVSNEDKNITTNAVSPSQKEEVVVTNNNNNTVSETIPVVTGAVITNNIPKEENIVPNSNVNINVQTSNTIEVDDELLDAFIGPNASTIRNQGISWPTFWLGTYYILYRKMWYLYFIMIVITIISTIFLPSFLLIIYFGMDAALFVNFNKMYVNHAQDTIKKIIAQNPNASYEEIKEKCRKKGGTSIAIVIIYILLSSALSVFLENENKKRQSPYYTNYVSKVEYVENYKDIGD